MKSRKSDDEIREEMAKHRRHIDEYGERTDSVISRSANDLAGRQTLTVSERLETIRGPLIE